MRQQQRREAVGRWADGGLFGFHTDQALAEAATGRSALFPASLTQNGLLARKLQGTISSDGSQSRRVLRPLNASCYTLMLIMWPLY